MEMCYDGALVMPSSYAVMDEEERMYVEGGAWSWKTLGKSLKNLWNKYSFAPKALGAGGITLGAIGNMIKGVATIAYAKVAAALGSIAAANWVVAAVITVVGGTAIGIMGSKVCFA